jgi:hypothetical protein
MNHLSPTLLVPTHNQGMVGPNEWYDEDIPPTKSFLTQEPMFIHLFSVVSATAAQNEENWAVILTCKSQIISTVCLLLLTHRCGGSHTDVEYSQR